jgi:uncharacterized protein (DUF1778 family)
MDDKKKQEAQRLAARAAKQGQNAVKNSGRAAEEAVEAVTEPIVDGAERAAKTVISDVTKTTDLTQGVFAIVGATALAFFAVRKLKIARYPFGTASTMATRARKVG